MTQVTINKGGTAEKVVEAETLQIHDLWHIAEWLDMEAEKQSRTKTARGSLKQEAEHIREVWSLAHDLKRHIIEEG